MRTQQLFCPGQNVLVQTQPLSNVDGIGSPRDAPKELECWGKLFFVEFHAHIFETVVRILECLQLTVVCVCNAQGRTSWSIVSKAVHDCRPQSCSILRVCSCTQLIQQDKRVTRACVGDRLNAGYMTREGRKAGIQGLFVTNVCKHMVEPGHQQGFLSGDGYACLSHEDGQTNRFERCCFSTCVGSGDENTTHAVPNGHVDGHRSLSLLSIVLRFGFFQGSSGRQAIDQEGIAQLLQTHAQPLVGVLGRRRRAAIHMDAVFDPG
mmetsp:Transcript_5182/g.32522  ORF Transcript_5182/g.32522 Transcript_5182/m.32522 type:complete len:264 (-) Transcript_5182:1052-1843(-)